MKHKNKGTAQDNETGLSQSIDELAWTELIQSGKFKIPVVLIKFEDMDMDGLHQARLFRQGASYQRTLFVLGPNDEPYLPKYRHKNLLERYSRADNLMDIQQVNLLEMQQSVARLLQRRNYMEVRSTSSPCPPSFI